MSLIRSYLYKRNSYVECFGTASKLFGIALSVPQGSVLVPLLFNLFINDIANGFKSFSLACMPMIFKSSHPSLVRPIVSNYKKIKNLLSFWCNKNGLKLNLPKCKIMSISLKKKLIQFGNRIDSQVLT